MSLPSHISLSELAREIQWGIKKQLSNSYWITAEISEYSVNYKGHCYVDLIEKQKNSEHISTKLRATMWAQQHAMISTYFETVTGIQLQAGISILCCVTVEFHELYGLSLNIIDIEPVYTIGEDERQRQEVLARLDAEGIIGMNADLDMPDVPQRIAVISSPHAAGYQDFMNHLHANEQGVVFYTCLFPAVMQGVELESSIIKALDAIFTYEDYFDAVVIIRGGGAKADLRWFDSYALAAHIAQFPIPVLSGIGHDKDNSVVDIVSYLSVKTPTAAADFFIQKALHVLYRISDLQAQITSHVQELFFQQRTELMGLQNNVLQNSKELSVSATRALRVLASELNEKTRDIFAGCNQDCAKTQNTLVSKAFSLLQTQQHVIRRTIEQISNKTDSVFQTESANIQLLEKDLELQNPLAILKKGYSITKNKDGKVVTAGDIHTGDTIITRFSDGEITSTVSSS